MSNTRNPNSTLNPIVRDEKTLLQKRERLRKLRKVDPDKRKSFLSNIMSDAPSNKNDPNMPIILESTEKDRKRKQSSEIQVVNDQPNDPGFDIDKLDLNVEVQETDLKEINQINSNIELEEKTQAKKTKEISPRIYLNEELPSKKRKKQINEVPITKNQANTDFSFDDYLKDALTKTLNGHSFSYPFGNVVKYDANTWIQDAESKDPKGNIVRTSVRFFSDLVPIDSYYFAVTPTVKEHAKYFLETLWENPKNLDLLHKNHIEKVNKSNKNDLFAQCISFMACRTQGQDICYVAPSVCNAEVENMLKDHAIKISNYKKDIQFVVLQNKSYSYQVKLERALNFLKIKINNLSKGCAEKTFIPFLLNLLATDPNLYIEGLVNCRIVPFECKIYGIAAPKDSIESYYTPVISTTPKIDLDKSGRYIAMPPCCPDCQKSKPAVLAMLTAAYHLGLQQQDKNEKVMITSLVSNSYR